MTEMVARLRVCFCATYPTQFNGYAKVGYELCRRLGAAEGVELTYFGFQNYQGAAAGARELPAGVTVYDAAANENPRRKGFGLEQVTEFFAQRDFDVVVVYNDMIVLTSFIEQLNRVPDRSFKIVAYIDQVYLYQKKEYLRAIEKSCAAALTFTPGWVDCLRGQGLSIPLDHLRHGCDPRTYFRVPAALARRYFGLKEQDFIVMNLNRNQPRKRWDVCLKAFSEALARTRARPLPAHGRPLKLLIGTALTGAWNLLEIFDRELEKRGVPVEEGRKHLIVIDAPQRLSDADVNVLLNCADVGINTCDGEGFGLCQFEQASQGIPQIVPRVGGFRDYLDDETAVMCDPVLNYYVDSCRDAVGGEAEICDFADYASAICLLYADPVEGERLGAAARERILGSGSYDWGHLAERLEHFLRGVTGLPRASAAVEAASPEGALDVNHVSLPGGGSASADRLAEIESRLASLQALVSELRVSA